MRCVMLLVSLLVVAANAAPVTHQIVLHQHIFEPSIIKIPAYTKVTLVIINRDDTLETFSSFTLNREKLLLPHASTTIYLAPMPPGEYPFSGEYHPYFAQGKVLAVLEGTP